MAGMVTRPRRRWRSDDAYARRKELYALAAPVFEQHGYDGATLKALAHACGLSIPGLYRYFPSKRAFALFPLPPLYPELHGEAPDLETGDPAALLAGWVDAAVREMPGYTLAARLAFEAGLTAAEQRRMRDNLAIHAEVLGATIERASPTLARDVARRIASTMIEMTAGPAISGLARTPADLGRDLRVLLRGYGIVLRRS